MLKSPIIACVIDVSSASRQSLPLAAKLAWGMGAKLLLIHPVSFRSWSLYAMATFNSEKERIKAAKRATPFVREIMCRAPGVEWELRVDIGDAAEIIDTIAEEAKIGLVLSALRRGKLEVLNSFSTQKSAPDVLKMPEPKLCRRQPAIAGKSHQSAASL